MGLTPLMGLLVLECHVLPLPKLFLATLPGLGLLLNASSCARRTVSSYKPKHQESEVEKGFCRPMQEMRGLCPPSLKICAGFQQSSFHLSSCLFLVALDLRCCLWALSTVATRGDYPRVAVRRLLVVVASLVARHRLHAWELLWLQHLGSVAVAPRLSCSEACEIFLDQGFNLCPLQ